MPDTVFARPALLLTPELIRYAAYLRGFTPEQLQKRYGPWKKTRATFGVVWVLRQVNPDVYSLPLLAKMLGYKDHTSVLHGYNRAITLRDTDIDYRLFTDRLMGFAVSRMAMRGAA